MKNSNEAIANITYSEEVIIYILSYKPLNRMDEENFFSFIDFDLIAENSE